MEENVKQPFVMPECIGLSRRIIKNSSRGGRLVGYIVAIPDGDKLLIGYSLCCKDDLFDRQIGYDLAVVKARSTYGDQTLEVPQSIWSVFETFVRRCAKYYKDKALPVWYSAEEFFDGNKPL